MTTAVHRCGRWIGEHDCSLDAFRATLDHPVRLDDYPFAESVTDGVLIYDSDRLRNIVTADRRDVQTELLAALSDGPGVFVLRNAFPEHAVIDAASAVFDAIIAEQRAGGGAGGDHFGKPGANDRIWNAAEKLAVAAPEVFVDYYANDMLALACQSWLGPVYQVTSQVNVVNPGGAAQSPHRDYHLGMVRPEHLTAYPAQLHRMSAVLTLQGAVAHCDMPVESGPTMFLPGSQRFDAGYLAFDRPEFVEYFHAHHVQLPLAKGDAVFFSPALYHGAGANRSASIRRSANLLQVSSPFGRAMEAMDRQRMSIAAYPALVERKRSGMPDAALRNAVVATAECYPFPTNLDHDQPAPDSLAPPSQVDVVWAALQRAADPAELAEALAAQASRRQP